MTRWRWYVALLGPLVAGCVSYGGIAKAADGKVYLTGTSGFFVFTSSFVKRCTESGSALTCESLTVTDTPPVAAGDDDDSADPKPKPKKKKPKPTDGDD
jgi:hypothetical protein